MNRRAFLRNAIYTASGLAIPAYGWTHHAERIALLRHGVFRRWGRNNLADGDDMGASIAITHSLMSDPSTNRITGATASV